MPATGIVTQKIGEFEYRVASDDGINAEFTGTSISKEPLSKGERVRIINVSSGRADVPEYGFCRENFGLRGVVGIPDGQKEGFANNSPCNYIAAYVAYHAGKITQLYDIAKVIASTGSRLNVVMLTGDVPYLETTLNCSGVWAGSFAPGDIALVRRGSRNLVVGWWQLTRFFNYTVRTTFPWEGYYISIPDSDPEVSRSFNKQSGKIQPVTAEYDDPDTGANVYATVRVQRVLTNVTEYQIILSGAGDQTVNYSVLYPGESYRVTVVTGAPKMVADITMGAFTYRKLFSLGGMQFSKTDIVASVSILASPAQFSFDGWYYANYNFITGTPFTAYELPPDSYKIAEDLVDSVRLPTMPNDTEYTGYISANFILAKGSKSSRDSATGDIV